MTRRCRMCGRRLTRPTADGIGPVCARKLHPRPAVWPGHTQPALEEPDVNTETPATTPADDTAMQALSDAGAICGECGDEPGDRNCPDCERCRGWYVDALRKAGWAPRAEARAAALTEAAATLRAIPVQCTALTGPVWFGTGWDDALKELEQLALRAKVDAEDAAAARPDNTTGA